MTDNDIVKAYNDLTPRQQLALFRDLYYNDGYATERGVIANAINDILPEYNLQKAEIDWLRNYIAGLEKGIESWKKAYSEYEETTGLKQVRAEAIKEFAERLKKSSFPCDVSFDFGREHCEEAVTVLEINNLVKEMTEDTP